MLIDMYKKLLNMKNDTKTKLENSLSKEESTSAKFANSGKKLGLAAIKIGESAFDAAHGCLSIITSGVSLLKVILVDAPTYLRDKSDSESEEQYNNDTTAAYNRGAEGLAYAKAEAVNATIDAKNFAYDSGEAICHFCQGMYYGVTGAGDLADKGLTVAYQNGMKLAANLHELSTDSSINYSDVIGNVSNKLGFNHFHL